jgi:hypothetical protein
MVMAAVSTSETSVNFYETTWRNTSEDIQPQTLMLFNEFTKSTLP